MTTSGNFSPDAGALASLLDAGEGPIVVLDPCGAHWEIFWNTPRWSRLWQAWRLAPGHMQEGDVWDVVGALKGVNAAAGTAVLAAALFPASEHSDLTRELMVCLLSFAEETGHISDLPVLAGKLWADDLWAAIAQWSRKYPFNPSLQKARALLTRDGASDAAQAIRDRMVTYHHPHVAETFACASGLSLSLSNLRLRPGQIIFLTPDIRCMESAELTGVYEFLVTALRGLGDLHGVKFTLIEPVVTMTRDPADEI